MHHFVGQHCWAFAPLPQGRLTKTMALLDLIWILTTPGGEEPQNGGSGAD